MPLTDPDVYRDKTLDWMDYFNHQRRDALTLTITPELIAEHENDPSGSKARHSSKLQALLIYLRMQPVDGKAFVYVQEPHRKYCIGLMNGRGETPRILEEQIFASEKEAIHAVFLYRLRALKLLKDDSEAER